MLLVYSTVLSKEMGKSKGRHLLMENYPKRFSNRVPDGKVVRVLISDMLSYLYSSFIEKRNKLNEVEYRYSCAGMLKKMQKKMLSPLVNTPVATHVVLFDKSEYTPVTKNVPDKARCAFKSKRDLELEKEAVSLLTLRDRYANNKIERRSCFINSFSPLPSPWKFVMEDRDHMRRWVVREIVSSLADKNHWCKVTEAEILLGLTGKSLVFDGHCMSPEDLTELSDFSPGKKSAGDSPLEISCEEAYSTPLVVLFNADGSRRIYLDASMKNTIGEADFTAFLYARRLAEELPSGEEIVLINSCDVDLCYLSMINEVKMRRQKRSARGRVYLSCNNTDISLIKARQDGSSECDKKNDHMHVVDPAGMVDDVCAQFARLGDNDCEAVLSFVCCMVCGGSDYTEKNPFVTHSSFWGAVNKFHSRIGKLVSIGSEWAYDVQLDGAAFTRLMKLAFCDSYFTKKRKPFSGFTFNNLEMPYVRRLIKECNPNNPERHFPTAVELLCRAANLCYYAQMMWQVGDPELHVPPSDDLKFYGYGTISDCTVRKGNIRRLCNDVKDNYKMQKEAGKMAETSSPPCL